MRVWGGDEGIGMGMRECGWEEGMGMKAWGVVVVMTTCGTHTQCFLSYLMCYSIQNRELV